MTEKQKIFADEYLIDLNATRAYLVAYPSVKRDEVARAAASRMLTNVKLKNIFLISWRRFIARKQQMHRK